MAGEISLETAPPDADRIPAARRAEEIAGMLEEDIALGQLRPRERLLEDELARRFDAKRHVVRQALAALFKLGIITHQPNRGAAVRDFTADEVEQLYEVRELVERRAAELIPLPGDPAVVASLRAIHLRHSAACRDADLRTVFRQNLLFHSTLFAACGNAPLVELVEQFAMRTHGIRSYTIGSNDLLRRVCEEHAMMIDCLERGDRSGLMRIVVDHLQPAKTAYLERNRVLAAAAQ